MKKASFFAKAIRSGQAGMTIMEMMLALSVSGLTGFALMDALKSTNDAQLAAKTAYTLDHLKMRAIRAASDEKNLRSRAAPLSPSLSRCLNEQAGCPLGAETPFQLPSPSNFQKMIAGTEAAPVLYQLGGESCEKFLQKVPPPTQAEIEKKCPVAAVASFTASCLKKPCSTAQAMKVEVKFVKNKANKSEREVLARGVSAKIIRNPTDTFTAKRCPPSGVLPGTTIYQQGAPASQGDQAPMAVSGFANGDITCAPVEVARKGVDGAKGPRGPRGGQGPAGGFQGDRRLWYPPDCALDGSGC